jgi:hypothetical protein
MVHLRDGYVDGRGGFDVQGVGIRGFPLAVPGMGMRLEVADDWWPRIVAQAGHPVLSGWCPTFKFVLLPEWAVDLVNRPAPPTRVLERFGEAARRILPSWENHVARLLRAPPDVRDARLTVYKLSGQSMDVLLEPVPRAKSLELL